MVMKHFKNLPIGNLFINHASNNEVSITIYTSRTAIILGSNDENIIALKDKLAVSFSQYTFTLDVKEVKKPELLKREDLVSRSSSEVVSMEQRLLVARHSKMEVFLHRQSVLMLISLMRELRLHLELLDSRFGYTKVMSLKNRLAFLKFSL